MPPVAAAAVGAAAGIGGSILSAKAQKKAANKAADTSLAVAQQNNALARDIYGQNKGLLSPYVERGNMAGNALNELLGLGTVTTPAPAPLPAGGPSGGYAGTTGAGYGANGNYGPSAAIGPYGMPKRDFFAMERAGGTPVAGPASGGVYPQPQVVSSAAPAPASGNAMNAFNNFANSAGMQFQLDQGFKAINQGYAAGGQLESGAALKALQGYGQQTALNNYFLPYMGLLSNQQGVGLSGASAVAGVGQNYVNNVTANNNNAGTAAANAHLMRGAANSNMYAGIGNALGTFASSYWP